MNFDDIKSYWEDRAVNDRSAQSTTQDFYLREIEFRVLAERIAEFQPRSVADMGCGDGMTTLRLAEKYPVIKFHGFDYSDAMIANAKQNLDQQKTENVECFVHDVCSPLDSRFQLIYSTRCLINLPDTSLQEQALQSIHKTLEEGGLYLMIENFMEGHEKFNDVRKKFDLPEISVRDHNLFFRTNELLKMLEGIFEVQDEVNISSTYYLVSRVIYSKICADSGVTPDYFDDHHRYACALPLLGEYGPVRLLVLKKI
jgi:trans-aconitate methyltransferase